MILRAAWVVPVSSPPIRDGFVEIADGWITAVGSAAEGLPSDEALDLGESILTPGLVNPHTHLELTCYAGQIAAAPFWDWIAQLIPLRAAPRQVQRESAGVRDGAWQSLRLGVTCVGDISRRNLHWRVLRDIPIRKICFAELLSIADDPPRNVEELRAAFDEIREDALLTAGITPHAPYTVPPEQIRGAVQIAAQRKRPWTMHWAETREEQAFLRGDQAGAGRILNQLVSNGRLASPRREPRELLAECVRGFAPGLLAHVNYASDADIAALRDAGHTVVYCPRAHRYFGHPPHPMDRLVQAGVPVVIGTDSAASNENLSVLAELQFLRRERLTDQSPAALLRSVTVDAARALGLAAVTGAIKPGLAADLAAFPVVGDDPTAVLVESAPLPSHVWVAGKQVLGGQTGSCDSRGG
ncbi:5-methylthioadenosine/S-adenosylhomocysteine deaminase [Phycisphaerae bacterium RAS1]|nr:5-methylthioadenosine/S-adenosylhomocysteine deaminase [Phycisphaerae bacterium RAS1]